jgi:hypothetical protein
MRRYLRMKQPRVHLDSETHHYLTTEVMISCLGKHLHICMHAPAGA